MLNPEVEKFPPPESHVQYTRHPWGHHHHVLTHHPFTTQVSLLLPDSPSVPGSLSDVLTHDTEFYHITNLPVDQLSSPSFIQAFLNTGQVYAVSCDTRLDVDDSAALTPDGHLHLLLGKFTYQQLPLSGRLSCHILRMPREKFVVEVDLKDPGNHKRVTGALSQVALSFNWWLAWEPKDPEVCPSSIAKYFHNLGYSVSEHQASLRQEVVGDVLMPALMQQGEREEQMLEEGQEVKQKKQKEDVDDEMEPEDILEWIGCQALGIKLNRERTTVCDLTSLQPCVPVTNLCSAHCSGFFSPATVSLLVERLKEWMNQRSEETVPWVCVTVYGHPDSPVSWMGREHSYGATGDNFYTMIVTRTEVRVFRVSGPVRPRRLYVKANKNK